ncbi:MAG: DUF3795 domain-containing protein [Chitinivibrionales bacterium]|nr:DUF3795 domain-containing protein [Chitinivibrionales bacterium]
MTMAQIAPCGMNCLLCYATMREKNRCPGCRGDNRNKSNSCVRCRIRNCGTFEQKGVKYCFSCDHFPCARLKQLDRRYRTKYGMSMIGNLEYIREHGIRAFVRNEQARWTCSSCGTTRCVHRPDCPGCGDVWR